MSFIFLHESKDKATVTEVQYCANSRAGREKLQNGAQGLEKVCRDLISFRAYPAAQKIAS